MKRQRIIGVVFAVMTACTAAAHAAPAPSQQDVFRSISSSVGHSGSVSGATVAGLVSVAVGVVCLAVVYNHRQARQVRPGGYATAAPVGPSNHPAKLTRELMRETGLTKAQVRQLEAANDRLAADDRAVEHLATLLLCPSLLSAAKGD